MAKSYPYRQIGGISLVQSVIGRLLPPLISINRVKYPFPVFCEKHRANQFFVALFTAGESIYHELGQEPLDCKAGTLLIIPQETQYTWEVKQPVTLICISLVGFAGKKYDALPFLFGSFQRHLAAVEMGEAAALDFEKKIDTLVRQPFARVLISAEILRLFGEALQLDRPLPGTFQPQSEELMRCIYYMEAHLKTNFTMESLARQCQISRRKLFSLFRREMGVAPLEYLSKRRLQLSEQLLESGETNAGIAEELGFSSASYFARFFKKSTGMTPQQFRKQKIELLSST